MDARSSEYMGQKCDGLPEEVGDVLYENIFTGRELLALSRDDLTMMGTKRIGTVVMLLHEVS